MAFYVKKTAHGLLKKSLSWHSDRLKEPTKDPLLQLLIYYCLYKPGLLNLFVMLKLVKAALLYDH